MASFGIDLTRERSFDQNVIHEHILQIGIGMIGYSTNFSMVHHVHNTLCIKMIEFFSIDCCL